MSSQDGSLGSLGQWPLSESQPHLVRRGQSPRGPVYTRARHTKLPQTAPLIPTGQKSFPGSEPELVAAHSEEPGDGSEGTRGLYLVTQAATPQSALDRHRHLQYQRREAAIRQHQKATAQQERAKAQIGLKRHHDFVFRELLGRGAFAEVYRAFDALAPRDPTGKSSSDEMDEDSKDGDGGLDSVAELGGGTPDPAHPDTSPPRQQYAAKVLYKAEIIRQKLVKHVRRERNILHRLNHPAIIKLYYCFQTENRLYFMLELVTGGDLRTWIRKLQRCSLEMTRSVLGELVLALEYMHAHGVIHRDLKPENVLLTQDRHVRVCDFGTALLVDDDASQPVPAPPEHKPEPTEFGRLRASSFVGSPAYVSPEILDLTDGPKVCPASDFWALGCIGYAMFTGASPFQNARLEDILRAAVEFPPHIPSQLADLIRRLLHRDPARRLGARGIEEIKQHPFFADAHMDWDHLTSMPVPPFHAFLGSSLRPNPAASSAMADSRRLSEGQASSSESALLPDPQEIARVKELVSHGSTTHFVAGVPQPATSRVAVSALMPTPDDPPSETRKHSHTSVPDTTPAKPTLLRTASLHALPSSDRSGPSSAKPVPVPPLPPPTVVTSPFAQFLLPGETIVCHGRIRKTRHLSVKVRELILTDFPRLIYIDPVRMVQKGEIPWVRDLKIKLKGSASFSISTPGRTYHLEALEGTNQRWRDEIQQLLTQSRPS